MQRAGVQWQKVMGVVDVKKGILESGQGQIEITL